MSSSLHFAPCTQIKIYTGNYRFCRNKSQLAAVESKQGWKGNLIPNLEPSQMLQKNLWKVRCAVYVCIKMKQKGNESRRSLRKLEINCVVSLFTINIFYVPLTLLLNFPYTKDLLWFCAANELSFWYKSCEENCI